MSYKQFECPQCYKRCGNVGALKTHMKTHEKPEPKSGSMLKWLVKRVKSEIKPKPKMAIELKPILKTRQLKLRKPTTREPTVVSNPVRPRPPRRPRKSKQPPVDTSPFAAPARLTELILTRNHRNFGLLTFSTSNHWNQIFLSWTKWSITKSTRRAWEWAWDAFNNGFSSTMKIFAKWTSRSQRKNAIRTKFFGRERGFVLQRSKRRDRDSKKEAGKEKAQSERSRKSEAHQTKPKTSNVYQRNYCSKQCMNDLLRAVI